MCNKVQQKQLHTNNKIYDDKEEIQAQALYITLLRFNPMGIIACVCCVSLHYTESTSLNYILLYIHEVNKGVHYVLKKQMHE